MPEFGVGPYVHDPRFYDHVSSGVSDLLFWREQVRLGDGPALELCCGSGRILIPLARDGFDVSGVDNDPGMLSAARRKAEKLPRAVELHEADARTMELDRKFQTIYSPCNSLQCFYETRDLEAVLDRVRAHLAPGGRFSFQVFNPNIRYMIEAEEERQPVAKFEDDDGLHVVVQETTKYLSAPQVLRVTWYYRIDSEPEVEQKLDMRCFYPQEMDALLRHNGFVIQSKHGSHDRAPFDSDSWLQLYVCGCR